MLMHGHTHATCITYNVVAAGLAKLTGCEYRSNSSFAAWFGAFSFRPSTFSSQTPIRWPYINGPSKNGKSARKNRQDAASEKKISPYIEHIQLPYNVKHVSQNPFTLAGCCYCCCVFVFDRITTAFYVRSEDSITARATPTPPAIARVQPPPIGCCRVSFLSRLPPPSPCNPARNIYTHTARSSLAFIAPIKSQKLNKTVKNNK